jgi:phenylacetate-CoA ligase
VGPIVGRKNQKLKLKGASLFPSTLQTVLEQAKGVESFVILARSESPLSDSVEVLVHGSASLSSVREALQARSKILPQVRRASRAQIEGWQLPPEARKRRTFVDLR